jgi:hypothetical protein
VRLCVRTGGEGAPDLQETLQNLAINTTALGIIGAVLYRDVTVGWGCVALTQQPWVLFGLCSINTTAQGIVGAVLYRDVTVGWGCVEGLQVYHDARYRVMWILVEMPAFLRFVQLPSQPYSCSAASPVCSVRSLGCAQQEVLCAVCLGLAIVEAYVLFPEQHYPRPRS